MLRLLIIAGVALMALGFGAAGWQYWSGMQADPAPVGSSSQPAAAATRMVWLASETGAPVPAADVRSYLLQDRSIPERSATITMTAALEELLLEGETLPDPVYLEVMADIRATVLAEGLCPTLTSAFAAKCAVASARVVPGSVDPVRGTARFRIELFFAMDSDPDALPDLALNVFSGWEVSLPPSAAPARADAALAALADLAVAACALPETGQACRVLRLSLDHDPAGVSTGSVSLGALHPLPEAMRIIPEIIPAPKG